MTRGDAKTISRGDAELVAPRDAAKSTSGLAYVRAVRMRDRTVLTHNRATSPLRLLTPRGASRSTAWLVTSTFGGGLVGGDRVELELDVETGAHVLLTSQASTKVYRSSNLTRQVLRARVADDAWLAVLPDPIAAFADARFEQQQRYELTGRGSLIALDWMTSGRHARGEHWQFDRYASRVEIRCDGRDLFRDNISLAASDGSIAERMGQFTAYGLVTIVGPHFQAFASELMTKVNAQPADPSAEPVLAAAPIGEGHGTAIRFAAREVERAAAALGGMFEPLIAMLGDDPWARRGTPLCI